MGAIIRKNMIARMAIAASRTRLSLASDAG
jgi:hypothetical protein